METQTSSRDSNGVLIGAILVLIATALGLAGLWWTSRPPAEGDPAVTFARDMIFHHQQAVEMANKLRERTKDAQLRGILLDMMLTQQAQIGLMQGWLQAWGLPFAGSTPPMTGSMMHNGMEMAMTPEIMGIQPQERVNALGTLPVAEAEVEFLQMMIAHHRGAVLMAGNTLTQTQNPLVRDLANGIIAAQTSEINLMNQLLEARGQPRE
jgi:uncharacterized protein (DUF305 family)